MIRFEHRLTGLQRDFLQAGKQHRGLSLDILTAPEGFQMTYKAWHAFAKRHGETSSRVEWDCLPGDDLFARFYGNLAGYHRFQTIASETYSLFCETDPGLDPVDSYHGWLRVLCDIARYCPTSGVSWSPRIWGHGELNTFSYGGTAEYRDKYNGEEFPLFPIQLCFHGCLFDISAAALGMMLFPQHVTFFGVHLDFRLVPWQLCIAFVNSAALALTPAELAQSGIRDALLQASILGDEGQKPHFVEAESGGGELFLAGKVLRTISMVAVNVCAILREFERRGWPRCMDNPIRGDDPNKVARDFKRVINGGQKGPWRIYFDALNSGRRLTWRAFEAFPLPTGSATPVADV